MAATTDNVSYQPKSVHRKQLSTEGQTLTVSSGAFLHMEDGGVADLRGSVNLTTGATQTNAATVTHTSDGSVAHNGAVTFTSQGSISHTGTVTYTSDAALAGEIGITGSMLQPVVMHTSNSTAMTNRGFKVLTSTENIKVLLDPPVTGSQVKIMMQTTSPDKDNAIYQIIVRNSGGSASTNARIGCSTGRMITYSTQVASKLPWNKSLELVGSTQYNGRRMWLISNYALTTEPATAFLISSATD